MHARLKGALGAAGLAVVACAIYVFRIHAADQVAYRRWSIDYYLLTPRPLRDLDDLLPGRDRQYTAIEGKGSSPAMVIAEYRNIETPEAFLQPCMARLQSDHVALVSAAQTEAPEPMQATLDILRTTRTQGHIRVAFGLKPTAAQ